MKNINATSELRSAILPAPLCEDLKKLRLKSWATSSDSDLINLLPQQQAMIVELLSKWCAAEIANRKTAQIESRIRAAKFNRIQTVDSFDFTFSKSTQAAQKNYIALHNSINPERPPSAVFTGTAGAGKTHLARALGYRACQLAMSTMFITAGDMVNLLVQAQKTFHLESELRKYRRPQVLIIDELGYVTLDSQASNLFFQVISSRHDQGLGTITTTNIAFGKFNQIFANDAIAHAIVDRLVNEAEVFYMEGPSYREHQRKQKKNLS